MASDFLNKWAQDSAQKTDEKYGANAYGGTAWLKDQSVTADSSVPHSAAHNASVAKESKTRRYTNPNGGAIGVQRYTRDELLGYDLTARDRELEAPNATATAARNAVAQARRDKAAGRATEDDVKAARRNLAAAQAAVSAVNDKYELAKRVQYEKKGDDEWKALPSAAQKQIESLYNVVTSTDAKSRLAAGVAASMGGPNQLSSMAAANRKAQDDAYAALATLGYSRQKVDQLLDYYTRRQDLEKYLAAYQDAEEMVNSGAGGTIGANLLSVGTNLASGAGQVDLTLQRIGQALSQDEWRKEAPLNYYSYGMLPYAWTQGVRQTTSGNILYDENGDERGGASKVLNSMYQAGMSMADSAAVAGMSMLGLPPGVGLTLLGGSAATSAMVDAVERGATDTQAVLTGLAAGVAEAMWESISLDSVLEIKALAKSAGKDTARRVAAQVLLNQAKTEGLEEIATDLTNAIMDQIINGDLSDFNTSYRQYLAEGMTPEQAKTKAWADFAGQVALSGVMGTVTGGIMGASGLGLQGLFANHKAKTTYSGNTAALLARAEKLGIDNKDTKTLAEKKDSATGGQIRAVVEDIVRQEIADTQEAKVARIERELKEAGAKGNVKQMAEALAARLTVEQTYADRPVEQDAAESVLQESLSRSLQRRLIRSEAAKMVYLQELTYLADETATTAAEEAVAAAQTVAADTNFVGKTGTALADSVLAAARTEGVTNRMLTELVKNGGDVEAMTALGVDPAKLTTNTERRAALKQAIQARVESEKNNSTEAGTTTEAGDNTEDRADQVLPSFNAYFDSLRAGDAIITEADARESYDALAQEYTEAAEKRAAEYDKAHREDRLYLPGTGFIGYRGFRAAVQDLRKADGSRYSESQLEQAFQRGVEQSRDRWAAEQTAQRAKLDKLAERINQAFGKRGLSLRARVSYDDPVFVGEGGKSRNAYFSTADNTIVFNGRTLTSEGAVLWFLGHEVLHPASGVDSDLVSMVLDTFRTLEHNGKLTGEAHHRVANMEAELDRIQRAYQQNENQLAAQENRPASVFTREQAKEELAADLMRYAFSQSKLFADIVEEKPSLAGRMRQAVQRLISALRGDDGRADKEVDDALQTLADRLDAALEKAGQERLAVLDVEKMTAEDLSQADLALAENDSGQKLFSYSTMREDLDGYMQDLRDAGLVGEGKVMSEEELTELYDAINRLMDYAEANIEAIEPNEAYRNMTAGNRPFSPYKNNADPHYKKALDFSTLCRKRLLTQAITEKLQAALKRSLTPVEQVRIRNEIKKLRAEGKKLDVACALCYVEAARLKTPKVINAFLSDRRTAMENFFSKNDSTFAREVYHKRGGDWKDAHGLPRNATKAQIADKGGPALRKQFESFQLAVRGEYMRWLAQTDPERYNEVQEEIAKAEQLDAAQFLSAASLAKLKQELPNVYQAFIDKIVSASRSKAMETDVPYVRGDINSVGQKLIDSMNEESGFRHQSWSDFQAMHLLDTIGAIIELSTRGAKVHAYTKVADLVRFLGDTGLMLNMSLIPAGDTGLDENGNLVFDPEEGIAYDVMQELRRQYHATAGNIAIGINDAQIRALLASDEIDYVIPYHISGLNADMRRRLGIRAWYDYSRYQNEKGDGWDKKAPRLREWFDEKEAMAAADGTAYMRKASEKYLALCHERGLTPKFPQFLQKNSDGSYSLAEDAQNYWKLLIDRKMVDQTSNAVIIQQPVVPRFNEQVMMDILTNEVTSQAAKDTREAVDTIVQRMLENPGNITKAERAAAKAMLEVQARVAVESAVQNERYSSPESPERAEQDESSLYDGTKPDRQFSIAYQSTTSDLARADLERARDAVIDYVVEHNSNPSVEALEEIRAKTGWWMSPFDKQWRYWVPDEKASWNLDNEALTSDTGGPFVLYDVIRHDRLFQHYPQLEDVQVVFDLPAGGATQGRFVAGPQWVIHLQENAKLNDSTFATLLHEIQHAIQQIEVDHWNAVQNGSNMDVGYKQAFVAAYMDLTDNDWDTSMLEGLSYKQAVRKIEQRIAKLYRNRSGYTEADRARETDNGASAADLRAMERSEQANRAKTDIRGAVLNSAYEYYREAIGELDARLTGETYELGKFFDDFGEEVEAQLQDRVRYGEATRRGDYTSIQNDIQNFYAISRDLGWDGKPEHLHSSNYDLAESRVSRAERQQTNIDTSGAAEKYSWDTLTKKAPVKIVSVPIVGIPTTKRGKIDSAKFTPIGKAGAALLSDARGKTQHYVRIADIGENVLINRRGVEHGIQGRITNSSTMSTAEVTAALPDILRNSVAVNEIAPREGHPEDGLYSYILFGYARRTDGQEYLVRSTVNHRDSNQSVLDSVEVYNVLKGIKAKKIEAHHQGSYAEETPAAIDPLMDTSDMSIANLLGIVKNNHPELLNDSLREHFGVETPKAEGLRFSISAGSDTEYVTSDGYTAYGPDAAWTEQSLDNHIHDYSYGAKRSKAYAVRMRLDDFLKLTTDNEENTTRRANIERQARENPEYGGQLDVERLSASEDRETGIFLDVNLETGRVEGHEGRHRAVLMMDAGVETAPVLITNYKHRYDEKSILPSMTLWGQRLDWSKVNPDARARNRNSVTVENLIPVSEGFREELTQAFATPSGETALRYSLTTGEDDEQLQEFIAAYEAAMGDGQAEVDYPTLNQKLRAAERAKKAAQRLLEQETAKRTRAETNLKDNQLAWQMYHKRVMRAKHNEYRAKLDAARKAKQEAAREAERFTREVERAKADIRVEAERMNAGKKAAKRLRIKEDAYGALKQESLERQKLRRNAARNTLKDQRLAERKRAEEEIKQGPVSTLRKSPQERKAAEVEQSIAQRLRTMGRRLYANFVSTSAAIERLARRQKGGTRASTLATVVGGVNGTVETLYEQGLVNRSGDRIGDAMKDVFLMTAKNGTVVDEERQALLQDYLLHVHNIDRMGFIEKARANLETFEASNPWLAEMDPKEFAKLVATTDAEAIKAGKTQARELAREYDALLQAFNDARDKAVFADENGNPVTAETSRGIVASYEAANPWLKEKAEGIYEWWDKFMRAWVVGTSITEEQYDRMREMYPHYVPTYRVGKGGMGFSFANQNGATPGRLIKTATGSIREIVNVEDSFANLVQKAVKQARVNELYQNLIDTAMLDNDGTFADMMYFDWLAYGEQHGLADEVDLDVGERIEDAEKAGLTKDGNGFRVSAWYDGELIPVYVSEELFNSLKDTVAFEHDKLDAVAKLGSRLTTPMKTAITGINPNFAVRNLMRDVPTAVINSISGLAFPVYWVRAWKEMVSRSANWQHYRALGGGSALYYNNEGGFGKALNMEDSRRGKAKRVWNKMKTGAAILNESTEAVTRFAEYLATVDKLGDTYENRLLGIKNAAEVTVDFSRRGKYGNAINAWIPYWNPAVQGIDKVFRSVFETPEGQTKLGHALRTIGRAGVTTALLEVVMQLVYAVLGRRDDWEELSDRVKDTYYCIPLPGEHRFLKIPKNREWGAILGTPIMRLIEGYNGRENPFEGYIETSIIPNFLPGMPTDIVGLSQLIDLRTNKDFAGRTIVPYAYQQGSKAGQYDSDTGVFAKWVSDAIGNAISPMQFDYIIQDYFGDLGKMVTMLTSRGFLSGEKSAEEVGSYILDTVRNPWVADNRYSNQYTSRYYDTLTKLQETYNDKKNHLDGDAYKDSVEYKTYQAMEKLYGKEISDLSKSIRDETNEDVKDRVKSQLVQLAKDALDFYDDSMSGRIKDPALTAKYYTLPGDVSNELIRLDGLSGEYAFSPTTASSKSYVDPNSKQNGKATREYILDDRAVNKRNELREQYYNAEMRRVINSAAYRNASDTQKAAMLEEARETAYAAAKDEFMDWLYANYKSTPRK